MHQLYNRLRSLLRGHERRLAEYSIGTTTLFVLGLVVIYGYVNRAGLDERAARVATAATMAPVAFVIMLVVWRHRQIDLATSVRRWSAQRVVMTVTPHSLYLALVGVLGVSYFHAQLGIALVWGLLIALPVNYRLCDRWSLRETDKA
ncbi:MAG TPA: hypothetical protein VI336_03345 [Candidatus Saccharimonadales bacterium]|nr:hypothetical protein [Candidatus Saccharimonadales bacterium]